MKANDFLVAVVGNCASGKTTLVNNLKLNGYKAVNVPQEHSEVRRLWKYKKPNYLILLSCTMETAKKRRPTFAWTQRQLDVQFQRLAQAKDECDLYIATDPFSPMEVMDQVIQFLEGKEEEANDEGR